MADKSNAMQQGHALWQRVFKEVAAEYPDITATHQYIDALAMFMVKDPGQYQVIVTNNLFGDIITDIGGALQGGLGMAASGNLHPGKTSLFEPVHGSAPPLAGKNLANPMGAILSSALMLETVGYTEPARAIERTVEAAVAEGRRPPTSAGRWAPARSVTGSPATCTPAAHIRGPHPEPRATSREPRPGNARVDRGIPVMSEPVFILGGARTPMTQFVGALKDSLPSISAPPRRAVRWRRPASRPRGSITSSSATCNRAASTRITARATSGSRPGCRSRCPR